MDDLVIVGAGLTGLFAAALATRRGARVTVVSQGRGGLELSHGCIDVLGATVPRQGLRRLRKAHPYSLVGRETLEGALEALKQITQAHDLEYQGSLNALLRLPTALGALHPTCLAPRSMVAGDASSSDPYTIAGFESFRDFHAALVARELRAGGLTASTAPDLPLLDAPRHRDAYATDLARLLDDPQRVADLARAWKPRMKGVVRLGLPAVIGFERSAQAWRDLEERLGVRVFEIPTLPPSVPGLRLERVLRKEALASGCNFIEGARAIGRVDGRTRSRRVSGVVAQTAGGPRLYPANVVLLATGGILHGGLVARRDGRVQESVFDMPVVACEDRSTWSGETPFESQPYAAFGLRVGSDMRPLDSGGEPVFANLFAAGGLLAGVDRGWEGSRQGIDLATAYRAVEMALP
ncbi:MAG: anaerobic glycerol-3-phosphate dehydrogenase subunit GlpB [Chloroflexota bacterium]